jgi:hypothetical protein
MELNLNTDIKSLSSRTKKETKLHDFGTHPAMYFYPTLETRESKIEFNSLAKDIITDVPNISVAIQNETGEPFLITGMTTAVNYPMYYAPKESNTSFFRSKPFLDKVAKYFNIQNPDKGFYMTISLAGTTDTYKAYRMAFVSADSINNPVVEEVISESMPTSTIGYSQEVGIENPDTVLTTTEDTSEVTSTTDIVEEPASTPLTATEIPA